MPHESRPDAVGRDIEEKRRLRMFREAATAYAAIAADSETAAVWRAEIATWDVTVGDGLPPEPRAWDEE